MNDVIFNEQSKLHLVNGVEKIGEAVGTTFGPDGRNVIIKTKGGVHITKDGATVASYVTSSNEIEQTAIDVVRDVATKTAKDVGDGTTTATILTNAIVKQLKNSILNPIQIQRDLQKQCKLIVDYLEKNKKIIESFEDIKKVATVSANNDENIGTLVAEAYKKVGKYGIVNIEESTQVEDSYYIADGMQIESGYISPFFINTENNTCELENVLVYIADQKMKEMKQLLEVVEKAIGQQKSLLIIAPDIDTTLQRTLLLNKGEVLNSCCIKSPNTGLYRQIMIDDIKEMLGETMTCQKVIITKDDTTFIGCQDIDHSQTIQTIELKLNSELTEPEQKFYAKRLANFKGGVCTIKVGGYSEVEIKEKKDRVEDAVCATRAALLGGILPGGGFALAHAENSLDLKYKDIITTPINILYNNSGITEDYNISNDFWQGINFKTGEHGNMYEMGIVDPFLVTKTALENATSAATLILTNGCAIIKTE